MRFTKKIKSDYCAYELKESPYKEMYDLDSLKDLELFADCNLTLAIDKLGEYEELEKIIHMPLDLFTRVMYYRVVYVKGKEPEWGGVGTKKDIQEYYVEEFNEERLVVRLGTGYNSHTILKPLQKLGKVWWPFNEKE